MQDQIITHPTAVTAKEKGFNGYKSNVYYNKDGNEIHDFCYKHQDWNKDNPKEDTFSAPTQSLLQRWLREKHDIHISITRMAQRKEDYSFIVSSISWQERHDKYHSYGKTYEEALEAGLQEALKLIK